MTQSKLQIAILAYIPVLHQGYLNFFQRHPEVKQLYLVSEELTVGIEPIEKEIRGLKATDLQKAIEALELFEKVEVLGKIRLTELAANEKLSWIMPDEEVMHDLVQMYFANNNLPMGELRVQFDSTFLRWDRKRILQEKSVQSAKSILPAEFQQQFLDRASELKNKSADWWRQVGGVLVKNGQLLVEAWNHHVPSPLEPYFNGDPRGSFHKGEYIELGTAIHAEAALIAEAAKKGLAVEGAELYATTFPCPVCAKLVAAVGIKKVFYSEGYAMLDGESILQAAGVEIFKVEK